MKKYPLVFSYACLYLLLICLPTSAYCADKVTLQLLWKHQFQFAGYYAAEEMGFYKDAGLDVDIREYEFGIDITEEVISGRSDFGVGRSAVILESMEGKPVTLLSAIFQHSPFMLLTKNRDDLKKVSDFKGKRIMVTDDKAGMASLVAMLTGSGVREGDYTSQKHSFSVDDLIEDNTDAVAAYLSNEPFQMEKSGVDYTIFAPRDHGFDFYSDFLFTSKGYYEENPELVERFRQATLRGWEYAFSHIDAVVDIILTKYNTQKRDKDALRFEAETLKALAYEKNTPLGHIDENRVAQIAQVYQLLGLTQKKLNPSGLIRIPQVDVQLDLTEDERAWLAAHRKIVVGGETDWAPFDFVDETGQYAGIVKDYLNIIGERLGIEVEIITGPTWNELISMIRDKKIDLLPAIYYSKERENLVQFTEPYLQIPEFIYTLSSDSSISGFDDLRDKRIVVVKGYTIEGFLRSNHPEFDLITAPTIPDALNKLVTGSADAFIGDILSTSYHINKLFLIGIEPVAPTPFPSQRLHMGVRKDWPVLRDLINKALKTIPEIERNAIKNRWISFAEKKIKDKRPDIVLTEIEQQWLDSHPVIRVHNEMASPPFNFAEHGRPKGFSIDYMRLLAEKIGIRLDFITGPSWDEFLEMMKTGKLDVMLNIAKTPERQKFLSFTAPYVTLTQTLYTRKNFPLVRSIDDLNGKIIAVPKGFYIAEMLKEYPQIEVMEVRDIVESMHAVSVGKADALYDLMPVVNYLSKKHQITNLKIGGDLGIEASRPMPLHIAVSQKNAAFAGILSKAMAKVTDEEFEVLIDKWLGQTEAVLPGIDLTPEERAWLGQHPIIRVHNELEWPPFNFFEFDTPKGLSIDYMNLLAERLGIQVEYITGPSWNEFMGMIQQKKLDIMLNIVMTEDRQKYLLYTEPYIKNPNVIVSTKKSPYENIEQLFGKTVALPKGFFHEEVLTKSFPEIKLLSVKDTLTALKSVSFGEADAAVGEEAVFRELMSKNMLSNLHISGEMKIGNPDLENLRIGIRDDWPLLHSVIRKAMASITPQEMNLLRQKWLVQLDTKETGITLTSAEQKWLAGHQEIRLGVDPGWPPYDYIDISGNHRGLAADVLTLLSERLGVNFQLASELNWSQVLDAARNRNLDIISLLKYTPERAKYLKFTEPLVSTPYVIVTSKNFKPVTDLSDMGNNKVAMAKDYAIVELSRNAFPNLNIHTVESPLAGLQAVSNGQMDAYVGFLGGVSYLIQQKGLVNLKIAAEAGVESKPLAIGVRSDWPELVDILNKGLASISVEEMNAIQKKWVPIEIGVSTQKTATDFPIKKLFAYGIAVFLTVSLLAFILIRTLRRENIAISFGSPWFRGLVLAGLSIFVLITVLLGWLILERNKAQQLHNIEANLKEALSVSQERLDLWLEERVSKMKLLGRDPELATITKRLLLVSPKKETLLNSSAFQEARSFFKKSKGVFPNIGFFIISPDHISIGSMRDANVGIRNLISKQHPELLKKAFQGKAGFIPPITSDVQLGQSSELAQGKKPPTMFFIGPVQDTDGRILAVMTLRVDPWKDLTQALKVIGTIGQGESYAFDRNGRMLSPSRFEDQLHSIGLLTKNQSSALINEIRDPGGNMVEGFRPDIERSRQPLTHMASNALMLRQEMEKAGIRHGHSRIESNIKGYRDYRGVPVFGAWRWCVNFDMGLVVEIDRDEALSHFYQIRMTIFGILGFTLFLSVVVILFVLIIGERTSRALLKARDNLEAKVDDRTKELVQKQEQLTVAEERSRLLLDSVGEGIFGVDMKGEVVFINVAACQLLGFEVEELIGQNVHDMIHHSYTDGTTYPVENCPMAKAYTHGTTERISDEILWRKDGKGFPVEYTATPVLRGETITGAVVAFRDITERKEADERFRVLFEQSSDPHVLLGDDGIIDCNNAAVLLMGARDKADLMSRHPAEFSPERQPDGRLSMEKSEEMDAIAKEKGHHRFDWTHRKITGEQFPVEVSLTPVTLGLKQALLVVWHDLTERKRVEEAMAVERERLQQILDTSPVAVAISVGGYIQYSNEYVAKYFGVKKGDMPVTLFVNPEDRTLIIEELERAGTVRNFELKAYDSNNQIRDILANYFTIENDGQPAVLAWWIDITDIKETAKELEIKLDELTRFRRLAVGREKKMVELKQEINDLLKECGLSRKYKIH